MEGTLDVSGTTLLADKVIFKLESTLKLSAAVEAVDPGGGTLKVLGITFIATADTRKEDDRSDNHFFNLADVSIEATPTTVLEDSDVAISAAGFFRRADGLVVEVEGSWTTPSLLATKVQIEHEDGGSGPPHQ